jgi:hypothetical protein
MYARNAGGSDNWGLTAELALRSRGVALSGSRILIAGNNRTDEYAYSPETGAWTWLQPVTTGAQTPQALFGDFAILVAENSFASFTGTRSSNAANREAGNLESCWTRFTIPEGVQASPCTETGLSWGFPPVLPLGAGMKSAS